MRRLLLLLALGLPGTAKADFLEVRRPATLKKAPQGGSTVLAHLDAGDRLRLLDDGAQENGYYHAAPGSGADGWVYRTFVRRHAGPLPGAAGDGNTPIAAGGIRPWAVHFLDVGTGDSAIIDMGTQEVVIDGGDSISVLDSYQRATGVIDDPIELVIVTHGDTDHWNGLRRLLGFEGASDHPLHALQYWDPGYDRDCDSADSGGRINYLQFVDDMQRLVAASGFRRPLQQFLEPAAHSGRPAPFTLPAFPGAIFTLLHSEANPTDGDCPYRINDASIVLGFEIDGVRFLFTGDANGKERNEPSPGTPRHVERMLLDLEATHPGTLKSDVLKVPHHGSQTASTQAFINAVDPAFAIISASTRHHLPKDLVVERYQSPSRVILRTDENRANNIDHIICGRIEHELQCNFSDVLRP